MVLIMVFKILICTLAGVGCGYILGKRVTLQNEQSEKKANQSALKESNRKIQEQKGQIAALQEEKEALVCEVKNLRRKGRTLQDESDDQEDLITDLKLRVTSLTRDKSVLEDKVQAYKDLYDATNQELERLKKEDE